MYTELKAYQMIISLLKKYGISYCVLSSGSRNIPFVHSVEEDSYFHCYSVVDERSAGYFAIGLSQELNEPVVISCTSSTATCNYWPPIAEAFYQNVPILVLTSDRDPAMLGQWEDQMIDQVGMYDRHVRKSVNLPIIHDKNDEIYCRRLINEALLELRHRGTGPVHINIPMRGYNMSFPAKSLPDTQMIDRLFGDEYLLLWKEKIERLKKAKKVLVACGQQNNVSDTLNREISRFYELYNAVIFTEYTSNMQVVNGINPTVCTDGRYITNKKMKELLPDIVISFGGQIFSGYKSVLQRFEGQFEHWLVQEDGRVIDTFKSLTTVFECKPEKFFSIINDGSGKQLNDKEYYTMWKKYVDSIAIPEFDYSHVYAIQQVVERIPSKSVLHLSINDSIRITNFFNLKSDIRVYANIGTHGIDGCLSTFLGQAAVSGTASYLIIGDLAFFYDMNALRLRHIDKNVHILLINNEGGSEFYYNDSWRNAASDLHTAARHTTKAQGWAESNDFIYLCASDKKSLQEVLKEFVREDLESPVLLEVFTEMKKDSDVIHGFYSLSRPKDVQSEVVRKSKIFLREKIGQEKAKKIANVLKKNV